MRKLTKIALVAASAAVVVSVAVTSWLVNEPAADAPTVSVEQPAMVVLGRCHVVTSIQERITA